MFTMEPLYPGYLETYQNVLGVLIQGSMRCPHFNGLECRVSLYMCGGSTVYKGVMGWNRVVPLYREVYSFQGVGIEKFHCIQRCPGGWNRGVPLYTEVSRGLE